jgi:hypothetical protein
MCMTLSFTWTHVDMYFVNGPLFPNALTTFGIRDHTLATRTPEKFQIYDPPSSPNLSSFKKIAAFELAFTLLSCNKRELRGLTREKKDT